jgi:flagellar hook assembly protein FlgD
MTEINNTDINIPESFSLSQNYPNPFNSKTQFKINLPKTSDVNISVYNINGQLILNIVNERKNAGTYRVSWDASNFSSGMYFIKLKAGTFTATKKCLLIK